MRIAYLVPSLGLLEGQGNVDRELLVRVARAGHQVDVFTSSAPASVAQIPGVRVRRIPRLPAWQFGNQVIMLICSTLMLRPKRYDLIHADAGVTLRRAHVMVCHTVTDRWYALPRDVWDEPGPRGVHHRVATKFKAWLELRQFRRARLVLANSRATSEDLAARGVPIGRIRLLPFGVDTERFAPPAPQQRRDARAHLGFDDEAFVVLFVGAHGPRKGLPIALDALAEAEAGEVLLVAGEHRSGIWAREANARKLPAVMPGKLEDIRMAYWAADVLAYPSRYDAFGMAVLEAMSCGLPVIVSRETGSHDIIRDAGFVLTEPTVRSLREAIDAVRADPGRRAEMGARARRHARSHDWDRAGAILLHSYVSCADDPSGRATSAA